MYIYIFTDRHDQNHRNEIPHEVIQMKSNILNVFKCHESPKSPRKSRPNLSCSSGVIPSPSTVTVGALCRVQLLGIQSWNPPYI